MLDVRLVDRDVCPIASALLERGRVEVLEDDRFLFRLDSHGGGVEQRVSD